MIEIINTCLFDFGEIHCLQSCIHCGVRNAISDEVAKMDEIEDFSEQASSFQECYRRRFDDLHKAFAFLPDDHYQTLLGLTEGKCPVCAIAEALHQFPIIAHFSPSHPLSGDIGKIAYYPLPYIFMHYRGEKVSHSSTRYKCLIWYRQ